MAVEVGGNTSLKWKASIDDRDLQKSIQGLMIKMESYKRIVESSMSTQVVKKYNAEIQKLESEVNRLTNIGKQGFDELGNKITGGKNAVVKMYSVVRQLAYIIPGLGIAGIFNLALGPIIELIKKLDLFKKTLTDSEKAAKNLSDALAGKEYTSAVKNITELKDTVEIAKKGFISKEGVVKQYNETIGKTAGMAKNLNDVEDFLIKNADNYVKMTLYKAAANIALEEAAKKAYEAEQVRLKKESEFSNPVVDTRVSAYGSTSFSAREYQQDQERIKKAQQQRKNERLKEIEDEKKKQETIAKNFLDTAAKLSKASGFNFFSDTDTGKNNQSKAISIENKYQSALAKRKDILNEIAKITDEYDRKSKTQEEAGREAIVDRFAELRRSLIKYNEWAANYNKTAAKGKQVETIGLGVLDPIKEKAIADYNAKIAVEQTKVQVEQQKQVYAQYEDYKTQYGKKAADERFKDELNGYTDYVSYIKGQMKSLEGKNDAGSNALKDLYKNILPKAELDQNKKSFDEMIKMVANYEDKRQGIEDRYAKLRATARNQADIAILNQNKKLELEALDDEQVKKLDAYKNLYDGIDLLSDAAAKKVIEDAKAMLEALVKSGKISKELAKDISNRLFETSNALEDRLPKRLDELSGSLRETASIVGDIDEGFGQMLGTLSSVVSSISSIKSIVDTIKKAQAGGTSSIIGTVAGGLGIVGAFVGAATTIGNLLSAGDKKRAEEYAYYQEMQLKQTNAITSALERQIEAINDAFGTDRLDAYSKSLSDITKQYEDFKNQLDGFSRYGTNSGLKPNVLKLLNEMIDKLNNGQDPGVSFDKNALKEAVRKGYIEDLKSIANELGDIGNVSEEAIKKLQSLIDADLLDDQTKAIAENIIKQADIYKKTLNDLKAETTGTNFDSIADDIVSMFERGTIAAEDFGKNFEEIMKKSILNSFKRNYLEKKLQKFYDEFASYTDVESGGALEAGEITKLRDRYNQIITGATSQFEELKKLGIDLTGDANSSDDSGLTGKSISSQLTEETGSELAGLWRGTYDIQKKIFNVNVTMNESLYSISEQNVSKLNVLNSINTNTSNTVIELRNAVSELKAINKNTGGQSARDLGV